MKMNPKYIGATIVTMLSLTAGYMIYSDPDNAMLFKEVSPEVRGPIQSNHLYYLEQSVIEHVKNNMHNPRSFELVAVRSTTVNGLHMVFLTCRGTNAFNAVVTNTIYAESVAGSGTFRITQ